MLKHGFLAFDLDILRMVGEHVNEIPVELQYIQYFEVWYKSVLLSRKIKQEKITDKDLSGQINRALNSIILNIAEGSADNSDIEFARFLSISIRSVYEVVAGFDIATSEKMIDEGLNNDIETRAENLVKQLSTFRSSLKKS